VAPTYLVKELAHMITMILHSHVVFDQIGNTLCCPQLRPITVCHGSLGQEANEALFLFRCQLGWAARCRLGFERTLAAFVECIAPTEDAARVTTYAAGYLMKGQVLFKECRYTLPTFFKHIWRTARSWHGDTSF
jgi:hypothetical protein